MLGDPTTVANTALYRDAIRGLSQDRKSISPKWLYDARGSALFEQITRLPEYYLTRTETQVLRSHARMLSALVPPGGVLVEIGSGASVKTRLLLDEGRHFEAYAPIDISKDFLIETSIALRGDYPKLRVLPVEADFLSEIAFPRIIETRPKVGFFPGSTIGNLPPEEARALLARARAWTGMQRFILGVDLVKDEQMLVQAYDDAQGVTAAFIKNVLWRLNTELEADFNLDRFTYSAAWRAEPAQIEMTLVSDMAQTASLAGHRFQFNAGEAIHVSTSRKFTHDTLAELVGSAGWHLETVLSDPRDTVAVAVLAIDD